MSVFGEGTIQEEILLALEGVKWNNKLSDQGVVNYTLQTLGYFTGRVYADNGKFLPGEKEEETK